FLGVVLWVLGCAARSKHQFGPRSLRRWRAFSGREDDAVANIPWLHMGAERLTEQEWVEATDPDVPLYFVTTEEHLSQRKLRPSNRKLRLFGCACCRRIWSLFSHEWARESVFVAEAYADGLLGEAELKMAFSKAPESLLGLGGWDVLRVPEAAAAT